MMTAETRLRRVSALPRQTRSAARPGVEIVSAPQGESPAIETEPCGGGGIMVWGFEAPGVGRRQPHDASPPGASARRRKTYGCASGAAASSSLASPQARSSPFAHASR